MTEQQATQKKGLSPLAWIGIGCGAIILVAFLVMSVAIWFGARKVKDFAGGFEDDPARAAAEMIVKMNPELELIESDSEDGTITIRVKESGEVATFDYSEIQDGKLRLESSEGKISFDATAAEEGAVFTVETDEGTTRYGTLGESGRLPDWLPEYPGSEDVQMAFSEEKSDSLGGTFSYQTADSAETVFAFYRDRLESAGLKVQETTTTQDGEIQAGSLTANDDAGQRQATVTIAPDGETTRVGVFFSDTP